MLEKLYDTLELLLCTKEAPSLREFCLYLEIDESTIEELSKRKLLKNILEFVDLALDKCSETESVVNLAQWVSFLQRGSDANDDSDGSNDTATDDLQIPSEDVENPDHEPPEPVPLEYGPQNDDAELRTTEAHDAKITLALSEMKQKYDALLEDQRKEMENVIMGIKVAEQTQKKKQVQEKPQGFFPDKEDNFTDPRSATSLLRRELKIFGQIAEQGKTDQLSFVSLSRQIESAVEKGYTQKEVVEAVIKAMRPEKSGTQLYQELATVFQSLKETPEAFLLRALDLRQKVLFGSKEADATLKYDPELVQGMFLRSVETGLRDDNILTKFRSVLQTTKITDEELIQQMSSISSAEAERQARIGKKVKDAQMNAAVIDDRKKKETAQVKNQIETNTESRILEKMEAMQAQIKSIQDQIKVNKIDTSPKYTPANESNEKKRSDYENERSIRACKNCKE
eukprot:gene13145-14496_t